MIFLTKILNQGAPESCLHFYKRGGGLFIKDLIEILIVDIPEGNHEQFENKVNTTAKT